MFHTFKFLDAIAHVTVAGIFAVLATADVTVAWIGLAGTFISATAGLGVAYLNRRDIQAARKIARETRDRVEKVGETARESAESLVRQVEDK